MPDPREEFELALIVDRVAQRTAGYWGWDPPEQKEPPDPSDMLDSALRLFPKHVQKLFSKPKEDVDTSPGITVTLKTEMDLSEDSGADLEAMSYRDTEEDEDGRYNVAQDNMHYSLWSAGGVRVWESDGEQDLKRDLREFERYLEQHDPAAHQVFTSAP